MEAVVREKSDAQVNARINRDLKARGDAAFAGAGLTSSEAIRLLYEFAAAHGRQPDAIQRALEVEAESVREARERKCATFKAGSALYRNALKELGIAAPSERVANLSYDELKELAFVEQGALRTGAEA